MHSSLYTSDATKAGIPLLGLEILAQILSAAQESLSEFHLDMVWYLL